MSITGAGNFADDLVLTGTRPLLWEAGGHHTRDEVLARAGVMARALLDRGVAAGDRVAILCDRPAAGVTALYAVLLARGCAVPLHAASPPAAMAQTVSDSGAAVLITDRPPAALHPELAHLGRIDAASPAAKEGDAAPVPALPRPDPEALLALLYTSGTTGVPKAVRLTHGNLESLVRQMVGDYFRVGPDDVMLAAAPLANAYGLVLALVALRA